jgi:cerevisin
VSNTINQGIPVIVAAGNDSKDASKVSPARVRGAITVGATTIDDTFASFSNFGPTVSILAPGQTILSAYFKDETLLVTQDGTSMAA